MNETKLFLVSQTVIRNEIRKNNPFRLALYQAYKICNLQYDDIWMADIFTDIDHKKKCVSEFSPWEDVMKNKTNK